MRAVEDFSGTWTIVNTNSRLKFSSLLEPVGRLGFIDPVDAHVCLLVGEFGDHLGCQKEVYTLLCHVFDKGLVFRCVSAPERPEKTRI